MYVTVNHRGPKLGNLQFIVHLVAQRWRTCQMPQSISLLSPYRRCCHRASPKGHPRSSRLPNLQLFPRRRRCLWLRFRSCIWIQQWCCLQVLPCSRGRDGLWQQLFVFVRGGVGVSSSFLFSIFWNFTVVYRSPPRWSRTFQHPRSFRFLCELMRGSSRSHTRPFRWQRHRSPEFACRRSFKRWGRL